MKIRLGYRGGADQISRINLDKLKSLGIPEKQIKYTATTSKFW